MNENDVKIAEIQETKLRETSKVGDTFNFILKKKRHREKCRRRVGLPHTPVYSLPNDAFPEQRQD